MTETTSGEVSSRKAGQVETTVDSLTVDWLYVRFEVYWSLNVTTPPSYRQFSALWQVQLALIKFFQISEIIS